MDEDEAFSRRAYRKARGPLRPYEDGETITFGQRFEMVRVSQDFDIQVRYWEMRLNGQSHNMAEMLATRTFPGARGTDRAFMQGRYHQTGGGQFAHLPAGSVQEYMRKAEEAGVNPTGKWYSGGLARFPGDPRAWVDGLSDVKRVAEERGAEVSGAIDVRPPTDQEVVPRPYRVASDLVQARVAEAIADNPDLGHGRKRLDLEEALTAKLSGVHGTRAK